MSLRDRVLISRAGLFRSLVAAVLLTLLAGAGTALAMDKSVTVQVDGQSQSVSTMSTTVDGALHAAELQVGEHDPLAPSASTAIAAGDTIVLRRGRLIELTIDGGAYAPLPHQATREQQIAVASKVQAARGWSPWPSCTSQLGLR